jgi:hypothetical protein
MPLISEESTTVLDEVVSVSDDEPFGNDDGHSQNADVVVI